MPNDLTSLSARAAVAALRAGEVEPRDLVEAALRRIEAVDGSLSVESPPGAGTLVRAVLPLAVAQP